MERHFVGGVVLKVFLLLLVNQYNVPLFCVFSPSTFGKHKMFKIISCRKQETRAKLRYSSNPKWPYVRNRNQRKKTSFHQKYWPFLNISALTSQGLIRAVHSLQNQSNLFSAWKIYVTYLRPYKIIRQLVSHTLLKPNNPNRNLNSNQLSSNKTRLDTDPFVHKTNWPSARPMRITSAFFKPAVEESPYQKASQSDSILSLSEAPGRHSKQKVNCNKHIDEKGWFVMSCLISFHFRMFSRLHMFLIHGVFK